MKPAVKRLIFFAALILFWGLGSHFELWHETILPSPFSVWDALAAGFADLTLVYDLVASFRHFGQRVRASRLASFLFLFPLNRWCHST